MLRLLFLTCLFLLFINCPAISQSSGLESLSGKWQVTEGESQYMIDFRMDSVVLMYSYEINIPSYFKIDFISNDQLVMRALNTFIEKPATKETGYKQIKELPPPRKMIYRIAHDTLLLTNKESNTVSKAVHCRSGVCDAQKDFFWEQGVNIDLPVVKNRGEDLQELSLQESDIMICLGPPKLIYQRTYGEADRFWCSGRFSDDYDLKLTLSRFAFEEVKGSGILPRATVFVDAHCKMEMVKHLVNILKAEQIKTVYFAIRANQDVSLKFTPLFKAFAVADIKIDHPGEIFVNWIQ